MSDIVLYLQQLETDPSNAEASDNILQFLKGKDHRQSVATLNVFRTLYKHFKTLGQETCHEFINLLCVQPLFGETLSHLETILEDETFFVDNFCDESFPLLLQLLNAGPYPATTFLKNPNWWEFFKKKQSLSEPSSLEDFNHRFEAFSKQQAKTPFPQILRQFHAKEILRIGLREITRNVTLIQSSLELSLLAETLSQKALKFCEQEVQNQLGKIVQGAQGFFLLGMGKLGGRELNFSSDIDVVGFYAQDEGEVLSQTEKTYTLHEYYTRLTEKWIRLLNEVTEDGFVYRVDLRLRPEGSRGPLVNSIKSGENYYENWGTLWERAAFLKARPIAGDKALAVQFLRSLEPFIYKRHLDFHVIEEIKKLKAKIKIDQARRYGNQFHVKLGEGGIREIEFFVQTLQLLHGGREFLLRSGNTLTTLNNLEKLRLIKTHDVQTLKEAYIFLRHVEHLLQFYDNQQTHEIPTCPKQQKQLAYFMKCESFPTLEDQISKHCQGVHELFESLLTESPQDTDHQKSPKLRDQKSQEILVLLLENYGKKDLAPSEKQLLEKTASAFGESLRNLPDWRRHLSYIEKFFHQIGSKKKYHELFDQETIDNLLFVFSQSEFLSEILLPNPHLLYAFKEERILPSLDDLQKDLATRLKLAGDRGEAMDELRLFRHQQIFRIGFLDLLGLIRMKDAKNLLTQLAGVCLAHTAIWVNQELQQRYGSPHHDSDGQLATCEILGFGSLGASELNYTSDLDLIFIYSGSGETSGDRSISNQEYFTLFAQRYISFLSTTTNFQSAYAIDTRLRPSGRSGTLVTSKKAFLDYHTSKSQLWELQALLRARVITSTAALSQHLMHEVEPLIFHREKNPKTLGKAFHDMRMKIETQRGQTPAINPNEFDFKTGKGALMDIEFITQFLQMLHQGPRIANTRNALKALAKSEKISSQQADILIDAYDHYRYLGNRLCLVCNRSVEKIHPGLPRLDEIARALAMDDARSLIEHLKATADKVRAIYRSILKV